VASLEESGIFEDNWWIGEDVSGGEFGGGGGGVGMVA
jgi:hypothetical protein